MADDVSLSSRAPWSRQVFEAKLLEKGRLYHIHHPFHALLNEGRATAAQIRGWVANRYYYQTRIPLKDAAILANCPVREVRQLWLRRILDQDGSETGDGGLEAWLRLGEAVGLAREELETHRHVLPGVRFACDAYLNFARTASWQEAACASLTELFAPQIHQRRLDHWPHHYPWIEPQGYDYFRRRLAEARTDVRHGLAVTLDYFQSREQQDRALAILQFKLEVLWSMLDAMQLAYVHGEPPFFSCPAH